MHGATLQQLLFLTPLKILQARHLTAFFILQGLDASTSPYQAVFSRMYFLCFIYCAVKVTDLRAF